MLLAIGLAALTGCGRAKEPVDDQADEPAAVSDSGQAATTAGDEAVGKEAVGNDAGAPAGSQLDASALLAARLPIEESSQGWVRLFDGLSLFGWEIHSDTNWRIEDGAIVVDAGEVGLLCTSVPWQDFELRMEIRADEATNSGIFLRTPPVPTDPAVDCYEVNVAPADNPFPTGSLVKRFRVESVPQLDPETWHLYELSLVGDRLRVRIDGEEVCDYVDPKPLGPGRIGLQHNQGRVAFRDVRVRPVGTRELLTPDLAGWKTYPEMDGEFRITEEGWLRVTGGRGQLESTSSHADFVLLAQAKTASDKLNSGIFFRCIPGETMNGYECQINHELLDGDPLRPADCGTGGIFRRQDARIVAADDGEWFSLLLVAHGPQIAAWVNGLQVTDWRDERPPAENPRQGLRLEPGTLMIQAHDPTTDLVFRGIAIADLP
ncbi:MAG: DUF1080 domain-containing protein [Planctomycetaceae bacterium]|nr:MAG: DUF1080 domain-containing protein [Planctomycetaceae bacterium]